jgi:uncharacterized protein (TIGR02246 family)
MTTASPAGGSATDEGDLVGQMMAAMRSNDPDVVLELYADDCQVADPAMQLSGKEGLRTAVEYFFSAFQIRTIEVEEVIRQDPALIIRSRWQVVHQGEYLGVSPSGKLLRPGTSRRLPCATEASSATHRSGAPASSAGLSSLRRKRERRTAYLFFEKFLVRGTVAGAVR